jgi:hypothetical protein
MIIKFRMRISASKRRIHYLHRSGNLEKAITGTISAFLILSCKLVNDRFSSAMTTDLTVANLIDRVIGAILGASLQVTVNFSANLGVPLHPGKVRRQ